MNKQHNFVMEIGSRRDPILRLRMFQSGDRVAHALELEHRGECQLIAASLEGVAADRWPPSPPLRDVFPGKSAGDQLGGEHASGPGSLLATGAAGTSFWSLAITRTECAFVFEHACRVHEKTVDFVGSTYELPGTLIARGPRTASLPTPWGTVHVAARQLVDHEPVMRLVGSRLVFSARSTRQTVRWQYQFSLGNEALPQK